MRIAAMIVIGALVATGLMWAARSTNRMYELQVSPVGSASSGSGMMSIAYANPDDVKVSQMTNLAAKPPIDDQLPAGLQVATFSLG